MKCVDCRNCGSDQTEYYDVVANDENRSLYAARCLKCFYSWTEEVKDIAAEYHDLFGECSICGEKAVLPDEWVNVCPNCMFFGSLK